MPTMIATLLALLCLCPMAALAADTLGIKDGFTTFNTGTFIMKFVKDSQTLYSLTPAGSSFDFMPSDYMAQRADNGQNHVATSIYALGEAAHQHGPLSVLWPNEAR